MKGVKFGCVPWRQKRSVAVAVLVVVAAGQVAATTTCREQSSSFPGVVAIIGVVAGGCSCSGVLLLVLLLMLLVLSRLLNEVPTSDIARIALPAFLTSIGADMRRAGEKNAAANLTWRGPTKVAVE